MDELLQADELRKIFASNFRQRRLELELTQEELAERLECYGPYISDLENGKKTPYLATLARIAEALETTPDVLVTPQKKSRTPLD